MAEKLQENDLVALLEDMPEKGLNRGEIGRVLEIAAPSRNDSGWILLGFRRGRREIQVDVDDGDSFTKLNMDHKKTLEEWAGASRMFALVFTDIVDSTTIANELRDTKWIEVLKRHFAQARTLLAKYDHHEIKIIGDSLMVVFRSAADALDFALALQLEPGDDQIEIRAGIHVGSASIVEDDIYGIMVNYTKRVESTENPNGIQVSEFAKTEIENEGRHVVMTFVEKQIEFKGFSSVQKTWLITNPGLKFRRAMARSIRPVS